MAKKTKGANKGTKKTKYFKDKAIINFLLQHLKEEKIDFSKVKISSFSDEISSENEEFKLFQKKDQIQSPEMANVPQKKKLPIFGFNLLNNYAIDDSTNETIKISSSIFQ